MTATIKLGKLEIAAVEYGSQGNAILGIRDSGKTYTATYRRAAVRSRHPLHRIRSDRCVAFPARARRRQRLHDRGRRRP
jgi:hypothetical protein